MPWLRKTKCPSRSMPNGRDKLLKKFVHLWKRKSWPRFSWRLWINSIIRRWLEGHLTNSQRWWLWVCVWKKESEKGVLLKKGVPSESSEEKNQEVSMVKVWPQQQYLVYHHVAVVMPDTNVVQNLGYQRQFPQYQQQPRQQAPRTHIDLIPMKYADLLPMLLERNLVHTKAPLPVPARLPAGYRADLSCAFHQGAPGHDIEHCFALKKIV